MESVHEDYAGSIKGPCSVPEWKIFYIPINLPSCQFAWEMEILNNFDFKTSL